MKRLAVITSIIVTTVAAAAIADDPAETTLGPGTLRASLSLDRVYLPARGSKTLFRLATVTYEQGDKVTEPTEGYLSVGGKAARVEFAADDANVVEVKAIGKDHFGVKVTSALGEVYHVKEAGKTTISVAVSGAKLELPLEVIRLPVNLNDASSVVVEALGLPDEKQPVSVSWPKSETIDGITYRPRAGQAAIAEHWRYAAYPGLVIAIQNGRLQAIGNVPAGE